MKHLFLSYLYIFRGFFFFTENQIQNTCAYNLMSWNMDFNQVSKMLRLVIHNFDLMIMKYVPKSQTFERIMLSNTEVMLLIHILTFQTVTIYS